MSRWFRFYGEAINDPKVLRLSDAMFRAWVTLLCIASGNDGNLPPSADIALVLRMKVQKVAEWLTSLTMAGLLDCGSDGIFRPHNWDVRQYKSDVSSERVKRFRERQCNVSSAVSETPPESEQKQITETDQKLDARAKRGARLPEEWGPESADWSEAIAKLTVRGADEELLKFKDYWKAQPGQRGVKLDWNATWRNWIRNAKGPQNHGRRTVQDAARDLHEQAVAAVLAFDEPAPRSLRDGTGEDVVRLLPPR